MHDWRVPGSRRPARRSRVTRRLSAAAALLALALVIGALGATIQGLVAADAGETPVTPAMLAEMEATRRTLEETRGRLAVTELKLERATAVLDYSTRYRIPGDLAGAIYDAALSEGVHPALGFQLVKVESGFRARATSHKGALGYTQIRLATARGYDPEITVERVLERDTNLRLGFRFLKEQMERFNGDLRLALLAYNRGPTRVAEIVDAGGDPANGYSETILKGMKSKSRPRQAPEGG